MPELKPCPFCGAEIEISDGGWGLHPMNNCYLRGAEIAPDEFPAWNRRPSPFGDDVMGEV